MRRVDTLRLSARNEALVRHGALLLEDALRTASFPEAGPGRVLLIRSLPVGVIHGHLPPSSLALTLEQRVRELSRSAVHAEDSSAARRGAVFFRDDAEPSTLLAGRLARGSSVAAWFWPLAVPGFHPTQPRDEALRLTLSTALRTSAGPAAAVRLVETLHAQGLLDVLLQSLRWQEGPELVRSFGGAPSAPVLRPGEMASRAPVEEPRSPALRAAVTRWVETWSATDARSIWLVAAALVIERRGRLADARLLERAAHLAARLVSPPALVTQRNGGHEETVPASTESAALAKALPPGEGSSAVPSRPEEEPTLTLTPTPAASRLPAGNTALPTPGSSARKAAAREMSSEEASRLAAPRTRPVSHEPTLRPQPPSLERGSEPPDPSFAPATVSPAEWPEHPRPTVVGGLLFLVPVLERLGIATLLEQHPSLAELDLPDRFLTLIAGRLGAPAADPSRVVFAPQAASPLTPHEEQELGPRLRGLLTEARRWCRLQARLGLHTLIRRPARITATRTHVDILFDIQQVDIRVRSAGLDVDPGWVPWLGRVVRFHYLYGES
ncbi:MAG TPA: hypothetical protein VFZ09_03440 [Archangium sp.]|uniref:hypothetical protein n=1 Tax=Archangium sp. TaxID=1872627 RepID=UPI002E2FAB2A|nr:hypothetical protein [Archangium sp.]HEX5745270.1 hypothetical protein [Archangium sp.]